MENIAKADQWPAPKVRMVVAFSDVSGYEKWLREQGNTSSRSRPKRQRMFAYYKCSPVEITPLIRPSAKPVAGVTAQLVSHSGIKGGDNAVSAITQSIKSHTMTDKQLRSHWEPP